jgi:hypothetical protein
MQRQQTIDVNCERIRIVARTKSYVGNSAGYVVSVNDKRYFLNCLSFAEAMAKAQARFFDERSRTMAKQKKAKKVSNLAKAAARQKAAKGARGAKKNAKAAKATKVAPERATTQQGAPRAQKTAKVRKPSLLNEAVAVLKESGQPMSAKAMVEAVLAKGKWTTKGKTPAATLYASILREIQKKGDQARFVKTDRGRFSLKS